jgi:SAM-dependent methyltransferase
MTQTQRPALPLPLVVASTAFSVVLIHTVAYLASAGAVGFADAMAQGGHGGWWPVLVIAILASLAAAGIAARSRSRFALTATAGSPRSTASLILGVWWRLMAVSVAGFVLLENIESLLISGSPAALEPLGKIGVAGIVVAALAVAAVAAGTVAVVHARRRAYADVLAESYSELVGRGVFASSFQQPAWAIAFVRGAWDAAAARRADSTAISILECGSGSAFWLSAAATWAADHGLAASLHGFDLSDAMVEQAQVRLAELGLDATVRLGDILAPESYRFGATDAFDLVFAYDVVQQLPADAQRASIRSMLAHIAPGGALVVFDNDRRSRFGRVMGTKKWLRRYFNVPLVPAFYIHARYPDLGVIAGELRRDGLDATVLVEAEGRKRALIVRGRTAG